MCILLFTMWEVLVIIILVCKCASGNTEDGGNLFSSQLKLVSRSACGQRISLSFQDERTIYKYLRYEGAPLPDLCVVHIRLHNPIWKYAVICILLDDVNEYSPDYDCEQHFKFYFGRHTETDSGNYYSCSDIRKPVCDYNYSTYGYAAFKSWDQSEIKAPINIKVYALAVFPTSSTCTSCDSTYRTYNTTSPPRARNKRKRNYALIIVLVVAGAVVLVVVFGVHWLHKLEKRKRRNRAEAVRRRNDGRDDEFIGGAPPNGGRHNARQAAINSSSLSQEEENRLHPSPSAPPEEHSIDEQPPSYASLFGK